jgi:hypothetical protein
MDMMGPRSNAFLRRLAKDIVAYYSTVYLFDEETND